MLIILELWRLRQENCKFGPYFQREKSKEAPGNRNWTGWNYSLFSTNRTW
jgi:hypothetical protein